MTISRVDFWFFITEFVTRNPNLGIPPLEDGLVANLLIFDYLYYILIYIYIYVHSHVLYPLPRSLPPPRPPAQAGGRAGVLGDRFWVAFLYVWKFVLWVSGLGR